MEQEEEDVTKQNITLIYRRPDYPKTIWTKYSKQSTNF